MTLMFYEKVNCIKIGLNNANTTNDLITTKQKMTKISNF